MSKSKYQLICCNEDCEEITLSPKLNAKDIAYWFSRTKQLKVADGLYTRKYCFKTKKR